MKKRKMQNYSLLDERIKIDSDFPIFMFAHSVSEEPISNLHAHNVLELGICLKGHGIFIIDNDISPYDSGDIILIHPGVYHRAKSGAGVDDLWYFIYFNPEDWTEYWMPEHVNRLVHYFEDHVVFSLVNVLVEEIKSKRADREYIIAGLINSILVRIKRIEKKEAEKGIGSTGQNFKTDSRITKAIDILLNCGTESCEISELAQSCNLSESRFRHLFKKLVGTSPKSFQIKIRINTAINLIKSGERKMVDIAYECGFESVSSFNRHFRQETGMSPRQWRTWWANNNK